MKSFKSFALTAAVLGAVLVPAVSYAGDTSYYSPNCYKAGDGSGYCQGSMRGFRLSSFADAWATFEIDVASNWTYFFAKYNSQYFSCYPDATTSNRYASALAANGYFYIVWNSAGTCTTMYVFNESASY